MEREEKGMYDFIIYLGEKLAEKHMAGCISSLRAVYTHWNEIMKYIVKMLEEGERRGEMRKRKHCIL